MSNRIKVRSEINVYEENDEDVDNLADTENLVIEAHWNYSDRIVLLRGKMRITVIARDLRAAIDNATNAD